MSIMPKNSMSTATAFQRNRKCFDPLSNNKSARKRFLNTQCQLQTITTMCCCSCVIWSMKTCVFSLLLKYNLVISIASIANRNVDNASPAKKIYLSNLRMHLIEVVWLKCNKYFAIICLIYDYKCDVMTRLFKKLIWV